MTTKVSAAMNCDMCGKLIKVDNFILPATQKDCPLFRSVDGIDTCQICANKLFNFIGKLREDNGYAPQN